MNYKKIEDMTAQVHRECGSPTLPIDCMAILRHYGLHAINIDDYKVTQKELYGLCLAFSDDSFLYRKKKLIVYRDINRRRTRFSLMHELGHYLLRHTGHDPEHEYEANYFASCMLAPRNYLHRHGLTTPEQIARTADISMQAAEIAARDLHRRFDVSF